MSDKTKYDKVIKLPENVEIDEQKLKRGDVYYDPKYDYTITHSGSTNTTISFDNITEHSWGTTTGESWIPYEPVEICSKCKKKGKIHITYNWCDEHKLKRTICKKCHTKTMDKLYGLDNNIETEETLYGKNE